MGKKLERIEKLGVNFFRVFGGKGKSLSQRAPKHTTKMSLSMMYLLMYQVTQCTELNLASLEIVFRFLVIGRERFFLLHDLYIYKFVAFFTF